MPESAASQLKKLLENLELIATELSKFTALAGSTQPHQPNATGHFVGASRAARMVASKAASLASDALLLSVQLEDAANRLRIGRSNVH
ncbi:MAG: hypothetical protein WBX25_22005 [Rhodomicrobium sp.]